MKVKSTLTATLMVAVLGIAMQTSAITWNYSIDAADAPLAGWLESSVYTGGYGQDALRSNYTGANELTLQSNVLAADTDFASWNGVSIIANSYHEDTATIGDTVNFDWFTIGNDLTAAGYTAVAFIKVLDGGASWATTQYETWDIGATGLGAGHLDLVVADAGAGSEVIQAGFAITGLADTTGSGTDTLAVTVIPEPATFGLLGLAAAGLFVARRFKA